jgi:hypothetical protein
VVSVALKNALPAGRYTVAFRVVSDDGHPVESSYTFQVKAAAAAPSPAPSAVVAAPSLSASAAPAPAAAAAAAPAASGQDHNSHWFMGVAGVAMILAGAGALVWERRHRSEGDEEQELVSTSGGGGRS